MFCKNQLGFILFLKSEQNIAELFIYHPKLVPLYFEKLRIYQFQRFSFFRSTWRRAWTVVWYRGTRTRETSPTKTQNPVHGGGNSKGLKLSPSCDLTKVLVAKKNQMLNNYWDLLGLCRDNNWMGPILDKLIINFKWITKSHIARSYGLCQLLSCSGVC